MKVFKRVIICILAIVIIGIALLMFISSRSMCFSRGRCLITKNNEYMLVLDNSPYCMNTNYKNMFKGLENGDEILVLHGFLFQTYPGETGVYFVRRTADGDITDISDDVLTELAQMGWIEK